jgi:hypothetical protein
MKATQNLNTICSIAAALALSFVSTAAHAQTTDQTAAQGATVTGDNNQVTQVINQTIYTNSGRGPSRRVDGKYKDKTKTNLRANDNRQNRWSSANEGEGNHHNDNDAHKD